jgi:phage-related protein
MGEGRRPQHVAVDRRGGIGLPRTLQMLANSAGLHAMAAGNFGRSPTVLHLSQPLRGFSGRYPSAALTREFIFRRIAPFSDRHNRDIVLQVALTEPIGSWYPPGKMSSLRTGPLSRAAHLMRAVYYRDQVGSEPVRDGLEALEPAVRAALDLQIDRLNMLSSTDPPLPFPHSSQVDDDLRELRCHFGRQLYRILYARSHNLFVLLHEFRKTTGSVPPAELAIARQRWVDFQTRMNQIPRRPPRAAGHDAP